MQNKLVFLAVLTSFGLVLDWSLSGPGTIPRLPKAVQSSFLPKKAKKLVSHTKHVWYSEHGMYCRFEIILERVMSATHVAVILRMRTSPAYEEEFTKMDYPDVRNEYGTS